MKFVLFHGSFGSPDENWFPELRSDLKSLGQDVIVPQFPVDDWDTMVKNGQNIPLKNQNLLNWIKVFETEVLPKISKGEKVIFVGHSLGPLFILHLVEKYSISLDCAIFVSPFLDALDRWEFNHANGSFYKTNFDFEKLKKLIPVSYVLYSDDDPFVTKNHSLLFANALDSSAILVRRAGHMNASVNLNEFPLVLELCKTRLDLSLYQKYMAHRKELYAVDYNADKSEEVLFIKADEIFEEGKFHFRNLKDEGFCTFYTAWKDWDTQNRYYEEARQAARRIKKFIRVFMVDKLSDLTRPVLLEQIKMDIASGIQSYLCLYDDVKAHVAEPDFGIWDNEYLCIVHFDKEKNVIGEVEINGRKNDIQRAQQWKKIIMDNAMRINNSSTDIQSYIKSHTK
jgi:uncharacterized protein